MVEEGSDTGPCSILAASPEGGSAGAPFGMKPVTGASWVDIWASVEALGTMGGKRGVTGFLAQLRLLSGKNGERARGVTGAGREGRLRCYGLRVLRAYT
jgi:hypothetical protein